MRFIAIDWSGDRRGGAKEIWLAAAAGGRLARLENGRDREQVAAHLIAEAGRDPRLVVGLDFAFSLPA
jgi:predicted O-methyltransferase YrrM